MDSFGNYPREKFDPFSVMLFKGEFVVGSAEAGTS